MSCPCDPEVLRTLAVEAQPLLGQLFTGSIFFAAILDPLGALVILGFAAVLYEQESYLLSGLQLCSLFAVFLLYLKAGLRLFKDWRDERRFQQSVRSYEKQLAAENAASDRQQQYTEK